MIQPKLKTCAGCGPGKIIHKCVGRDRYCKKCWFSRKPTKRIRNRSVKRAKQERVYAVQNKEFKLQAGKCIAGLPGCTGYNVETLTTQHTKGRIGDLLLDQRHQIVICFSCHRKVNDNPKMAKALGLEKSRLAIEQTKETNESPLEI